MNTHTKTYNNFKCLYNTQGVVDCVSGVNELQNNGDVHCAGVKCLTPNTTTTQTIDKLVVSGNEQLFNRFVDEKFTWK